MGKLQLISNNEKFRFVPENFNDTEFFYRRITTTAYLAIVKNHTEKGNTINFNGVGLEVLEKYVTGWKGIVDEKGKETPFDPKFVSYLPDEIQAQLIECIRGIGGESVLEKEKK